MRLPLRQPKTWRLRPPDYREQRDDRVLLVWGDIPFWTVVDGEFAALLDALDGQALDAVFAEYPAWQPQQREIEGHLQVLRKAGIFSPAGTTAPPPAKIENVALNLTLRCNLRCRFCYNLPALTADGAGEVTADEVIAFLSQTRPLLGKEAALTVLGGEPLLEPDKLLSIASWTKRQRLMALVSTNGTLVTDDFARRAAEAGLQVQVSLDGHTAALHDAIRGKGQFARTVAGIRTLVRHGVYTIASLVCHRGNVPHLETFCDCAARLKVNEARFIPLKRMGGALAGDLVPVPLDELLATAFALVRRRRDLLPLLGRDALSIQAATCRYSARRHSCGTGLQTVLLDADGSLYPCLNTARPEFRLGSVREPGFDFRRLWRKSPLLHAHRQLTAADTGEHAACPLRYWCLGGCRGENFALTGSLDRRPPHCPELKRGIIAMFWMLADEPELIKPAMKIC